MQTSSKQTLSTPRFPFCRVNVEVEQTTNIKMTEIKIDPEKKYTGKVAKWLNHKGIGFIAGTYFLFWFLFDHSFDSNQSKRSKPTQISVELHFCIQFVDFRV